MIVQLQYSGSTRMSALPGGDAVLSVDEILPHICGLELAVTRHTVSARGPWVWLRGLGPARGPITGADGVRELAVISGVLFTFRRWPRVASMA